MTEHTREYAVEPLLLLPRQVSMERCRRVLQALEGAKAALVSTNACLYYLTGRVFSGYALLVEGEEPVWFVKRPVHLRGERVVSIHKPENIPAAVAELGITLPTRVALELSVVPYATVVRLQAALGAEHIADCTAALKTARSRKDALELEFIAQSGRQQTIVYERIPSLFRPGMTDIDLQIAIEAELRREGCLGQFRVSGEDMELHMGSLLVGDNADAPSPYDFAMGGAGASPSLPVGASGLEIIEGMAVMVDMNGNFTGYMTDMTRTYARGLLPELAQRAHELSRAICAELQQMGRPGMEAKLMYDRAHQMAREAGLEHCFMGHRQHAGFVGHGVGIEVNEWPVIAPRSRQVLEEGNVIALEPKFVIPGCGAVGVENTYAVTAEGPMQCLTLAPEQLTPLAL